MGADGSYERAVSSGGAIAWACRQAVAWGALALVLYFLVGHRNELLPRDAVPPPEAAVSTAAHGAAQNTLVYPTDAQGHVELDADVEGAIVHFIVDTGATRVTLTLRDAEAIGISRDELDFTIAMNTANGRVQAAPITLRTVRLGQFVLYDVRALVVPNLSVSLLGMSFLSRLDRWEMSDGALTISW